MVFIIFRESQQSIDMDYCQLEEAEGEKQGQGERESEGGSLAELSALNAAIDQGLPSIRPMKRFIDLYVRCHKNSEDFFMILCEYCIVPRLFALSARGVPSLDVLQTFNLLLANTSHSGQLVYMFSQPSLHDFLFDRFSIERENAETVEYYVQLLKTLILRLSNLDNGSMIKLFCNLRFPHFPLLTAVAMLGVDQKHEQLVRVTANQCVLLLIHLLNETSIGLEYLSELQMVVYFHQLLENLFSSSEEECGEQIRFVVDLILCLRTNVASLSVFMNLMTNHLLFRHGHQPISMLHFIGFFYDHMTDHSDFPKDLAEEIILVLSRILGKYFTANAINYTYFTAQKVLAALSIPGKPSLARFYLARCKKIEHHLIREGGMGQEEKELEFVLEEWLHFNYKNKEVAPLRDLRVKPKSAISEFFTSKEEFINEYIQNVMTLAGLDKTKLKGPIYKLSYSTDYQTALYLVELVCTRFPARILHEPKAKDQFHTDRHWQLHLSEDLLLELYKISTRITKARLEGQPKQIKSYSLLRESLREPSKIKSQPQSQNLHKMKGFVHLIKTLRPELMNLFCRALASKESRPELNQLALMSAIGGRMNLNQVVGFNHIELMLSKLKELQIYITDDVFSQDNFNFAYKYITRNREKTLLKKVDRNNGQPQSPKKFAKARSKVQNNLVQYEVIKRLINSSVKGLTEFMREYWECRFYTNAYPVTQFLYQDSNGTLLEVIADQSYEFALRKSKNNESSIYCITRDDCNLDRANPTLLSFEDSNYLIDFETQEKASRFREDLKRLRKERVELIMSGILEYLTFSYESLSASCAITKTYSSSIR